MERDGLLSARGVQSSSMKREMPIGEYVMKKLRLTTDEYQLTTKCIK
jgi:hypothetical protein